MPTHTSRLHRSLLSRPLILALLAAFIVSVPAAAFNAGWTKPKRIFSYSPAPVHSMAVDADGHVHVATERGGGGVWYVTNTSGSWTSCQVSDGNDRRPSVAVADGVVHIAFARTTDGQKGIYTASGASPTPAADCGWSIKERYSGSASHPALGVASGKLSIAFRTGDLKLKFIKGTPADTSWDKAEVIDGKCCTSPVALDLTSGGAPRVAYGDGTSRADGLKYATRTSKGWKKSKVQKGRIKHVDLTLDKTPGLFGGGPSNSPRLAYVVKRKGLFMASKAGSGWSKRGFGRATGPAQISHHSNLTEIVTVNKGNLAYLRSSGGIWGGNKLSGGGTDALPQLSGGKLTFSRKAGSKGIFFTRPK